MSKVLKVGGVTPSGVASGLRLTENGMLPIYSPQKDFFIGSVVEPVPHGHVGARGVFGLKCRAKTALHNAYNGGMNDSPIITDYGVVVSGMDRLQAFDGNLNPLWDVSFRSNRKGFARSVNKGGVVAAKGAGVDGLQLHEFDRSGSLVVSKNIDNVGQGESRGLQALDGHYFLAHQVPNVSVSISKIDASLDVVWKLDYPVSGSNADIPDLLQYDGVLYLLVSHFGGLSLPSVLVIDPDDGSVLKEWYAPGRLFSGAFWDGYLYCITSQGALTRIKLDAGDSETFETVRGSTGVDPMILALVTDNNGHFFAISTHPDAGRKLWKLNAEGEIELEVRYQDSLGAYIREIAYHNGSIIACTWNELLVLSEDLQLKGYTLS